MIGLITTLFITGCQEETPLSAGQTDSDTYITDHSQPLARRSTQKSLSDDNKYPQTASCVVRFFKNWDGYRGSSCQVPNGSFFEFYHGALNPPESVPWGEELTITMKVEMDPVNRELIYSFSPAGCAFDPPAKMWLDWSDLGSASATLFYLNEDGTRTEQSPDQIDVPNKHMCIYIDHFSRYALAYSN